jgi:hypothetical protein
MRVQKINLSNIQETLRIPYDLFICSSSYEERCLSIPNNISVTGIRRALILSNNDLLEYVGTNKIKLENLFSEKGQIVEVSTVNPLLTADNLDQSLAKAIDDGFTGSILLDVTAFTHESLLILLRLLKLRCPNTRITCAYANASEYSMGDDVKYKWLSRGIGEVRSVLGFPGNIVPSRKTHLILIVGYEHERAAGIIETIEPNSIALGYGRSGSATTDKNKDANEHYMHLVEQMATSFSDVNCFEIPCDDPYETRNEIQAQISKAGNRNILIAPMNNKLSTIGAALVALNDENVQLCYAQALSYNYSGYSSPGSHCYIFDLKIEK